MTCKKAFHLALLTCATLAVSGCETAEEQDRDIGFRGFSTSNGLELSNGLRVSNGLALTSGAAMPYGLAQGGGLSLSSGLAGDGLNPTTGFMASEAGRKLVKYLVECALPTGDAITKNGYTFKGMVGLAPQWKNGSCDFGCQEWVSACLLARTNEFGIKVSIDMRAPTPAIGLGVGDPAYTEQEGVFFGNLFSNPPRAFACMGEDWGNAQFVKRDCTTGTPGCFIKNTNYLSCFRGCTFSANGTALSCPDASSATWNRHTYNAVITTYLKLWWTY